MDAQTLEVFKSRNDTVYTNSKEKYIKNTGMGCHFLLQGNLPDPGIKPMFPALAGRFFTTEPLGELHVHNFYLCVT